MGYVKYINGEVIATTLPDKVVKDDGSIIFGFRTASDVVKAENNWYKLIDERPTINPWQKVTSTSYVLDGIQVKKKYVVNDIKMSKFKEDKISQLKKQCSQDIYSEVPEYKQSSASLGLYSTEEIERIKQIISTKKSIVDKCEEDILNSTDYQFISDVYYKKDIYDEETMEYIETVYWGEVQ